jgi:hypothetical protein
VTGTQPEGTNSAAPPRSVFVDDSGTKRRRARHVGVLLALGLLGYGLVLLAGVVLPVSFPNAELPSAARDDPAPRGPAPATEGVLLGPAPGPSFRAAGADGGAPAIVGTTPVSPSPVVVELPPLPTAPPSGMPGASSSDHPPAGEHVAPRAVADAAGSTPGRR